MTTTAKEKQSIAKDNWVDFSIAHWEEYKAIMQIYKDAEKKIGSVCVEAIKEIFERCLEGGGYKEQGFKFEDDEDESRAIPSDYEKLGLKFGYEGNPSWDALWKMNRDDLPWFYVFLDEIGKTKKENKELLDRMRKYAESKKAMFTSHGMELFPDPKDEPYIAVYYLNNEVNLKTIADAEKFEKLIENAFTQSMKGFVNFLEHVRKAAK